MTRCQNVLVLYSLSVMDSLLSHLLRPILLSDCGLLGCHCLSIAGLGEEYTVLVVVVTDFEGPLIPPPKLDEKEEEEKPPLLLLKKGSLSNTDPKPPPLNPPNPPNPL